MAVFFVGIADIDGRQNHAVLPGTAFSPAAPESGSAQQLPVRRGQQGLFQRAVGEVLLDHQPQPSACCTSMMVSCRLSFHACSVVTL
jgi:hypothetical protein